MPIIFSIIIILFASYIIYRIGDVFADASSNLGEHFRLPKSVKGATFDAVASSLPELLVALFAVIFFRQFEVGIGTIAGSALFNLLIIPGICVLVSPVKFVVSKEVISRDALYYILTVFLFLVLTLYLHTWGIIAALVLITSYLLYIKETVNHSKKYRETKSLSNKVIMSQEIYKATLSLLVIAVATYFLTRESINLSTTLGVSPVIIAFSITAAATSVPDTVISVINAKKGNIDDAVSNVFGSNIFDILFGLGFPLLVYNLLVGSLEINFKNIEIIIGLLGSTIIVLYFLAQKNILTKMQGKMLLVLYVLFLFYVIFIAQYPSYTIQIIN